MDNDIEEIENIPDVHSAPQIEDRSDFDPSMLNDPGEKQAIDPKINEELELRGPPLQRRRQSLFSEDDTISNKEGELTSQYSLDTEEQASRRYQSRLSVSAEIDESIRDRIRNKFAHVLTKAQNRERFSRRLTVLRQRSMVEQRSVEEEDGEDDIESKLEKSFEKRNVFMQKIAKDDYTELPSPEVQYDFFTNVGLPKLQEENGKVTVGEEMQHMNEEENIEISSTGRIPIEDRDESKEQMARIGDTEDWAQAVMTKAHLIPFSEQILNENKFYFTPSFFPIKRAVPRGDQHRLEEEGFYSPQLIRLPQCNVNIMEERLLNEPDQGSGWFGQNGKLISAVPTLSNFPARLDSMMDKKLDVVYSKATMARHGLAQGVETYQLDVDVSKLLFTHHPLFSKENVLAMRLMELYKNYLQRRQENMAEYYARKLEAVIDRLHNSTLPDSSDKEQISSLRKETRELRLERNKEEALDRKLIQNILHTWNMIKRLRQKQGYTTTSLQLFLKKQSVDANSDRAAWEADLIDELNQEEMDYNEWCQKQMEAFQAAQQKDRRDQYEDDENAIDLEPPQFPPFDREEMWNRLVKTALEIRRNPGEPIFVPVLGSSATVTPMEKCPIEEKERRREIARIRISMRIYFNDLEVCTTPSRPLNSDFCVTFGHVYDLHVFEWPQSIRVKIFETSGVGAWEHMATVFIPVPSISQITTPNINALEEIEFSNPNTKTKTHAGVGSGVAIDFQIDGQKTIIPCTSGVLQCSALWGRAKDGRPLAPSGRIADEIDERFPLSGGLASIATMEDLQQMLKTSKFDPNNPENRQLHSVIKDLDAFTKGTSKQLECFRLEPTECELIPEEVFIRNPRFRLLQLRHEQIAEFRNMRMIPAATNEIPADIFNEYERRIGKEKEKLELSDIDAYRQAADKYLTSVRAQMVQRLSTVQQSRSVQDMVNEEPLPTLRALTLLFEERGRPLKPVRKERRRLMTQNLAGIQVKLAVNIVRAFNVPIRDEKMASGTRTDSVKAETHKVEPYVEVTFQGQSVRTSVLQGQNPTWNQQLMLIFTPPNDDYSSSSLQRITDPVIFNLYDRIVSPLPHDNREGDSAIHQQVEKRWLGTLKIPFCTIYYSGKISGAFRLKLPPVQLGYTMGPSRSTQHASKFPHLHMFIAIDPPLMPQEPIRTRFESIESESFLQYSEKWIHDLHQIWPMRRYLPLIIDTHGRTDFIGRFLRPIRPPQEIEAISVDKKAAADLACHIVSLIPFLSDPVSFPGLCDIWNSCDQFLDMSCGHEEEHAVLLWCWLSYLGIQCYLLLGNGIPEGPRAAYVMAQLPIGNILYNASDGSAYSVQDPLCPLRSVGCAVSRENLWANIQMNDHPSAISFHFTKTNAWRPFFHKGFPNPDLPSVQPESLLYYSPEPMSVVELQENIERVIRERIMLWRPHQMTRWNRYAAQSLRQLLPIMETASMVEDIEERHVEALQSIYDSYKVTGFPLHSGYVSIDRITDTVYSTNVHANLDPNVEFALAVYVQPYTNNILSVWIYIASLVKRR